MKFLLIDDSPSDRERILRVLQEAFRDSEFVEITRSRDWEEALAGGGFDLVLTEYRLDWTDGLEVLRTIRKRFPQLPVVMVTGTGSEEVAVQGMKSGLSDYVSKGSLHRLSAAVRQSLEKAAIQDIAALKRAEEAVRQRDELAARSRIIGAILQTHDLDKRLNLILDELMTLFGVEFGAIYFVEAKYAILRVWRGLSDEFRALMMSFSADQPPQWMTTRHVVRERLSERGNIFSLAKREGIQALVCVPLKTSHPSENDVQPEKWLGSVMLGSRRYDAIREEDLGVLQPLVEQLTLAIDHARYYREAEERLTRLTVLRDIDRAIMTRQSIRDILNIVVEHVPKELGAEASAVSLLDKDQLRSHVFAMRLPNGMVIEQEAFTVSDSLLHWFVERKKPVIIYELEQDPRVQMHRAHLRYHRLVSYLGVPLVAQDKTIGILHLLTTQPKVFAEEDVDFFRTLAGQAAIAIENARLFDEARQAEQKYRSIFENAVEGIFQTTPDGRCLMANPAAVHMLGYECPEELMTDITDIERQLYVDPERRSALKRLLEERGVVQGFECQFNRKDGSTIWVSMSLRAVRDANGVVFCHEGTVEDITERKRAEEAMESALKDWQNTFEAISDGLWILDLEGRVVRSNGRIESLLGIRTEDIRGRHCYQVVHGTPDFIESCVFQRVKQTHTRGWAELEDQERGVWLQVTVDPLYDKSGAIEGAVHVIRDITEHKRSEERLQQQLMRISLLSQIARAIAERQDLESIFRVVLGRLEEHLPIDFGEGLLFDPQSDTLTVAARGPKSRQLAGDLGLAEGKVMPVDQTILGACVRGETVYLPDLAEADGPISQKLAQGGICSVIATPLAVEGQTIGILICARREVDGFSGTEDEFLRILGEHVALAAHHAQLDQDLQRAYDDLRRTQQAVMQQERLRALGQMAGGIVHDINNALSPIVGFSELLMMTEKDLSDRARQYLEMIQTAGRDIAHIVARMREFYRKREEREELFEINLNDLIQQVIDMSSPRWKDIPQEKGVVVEMRTDFAPHPARVRGVNSEIREALTNLIFNAVDAMPHGGMLAIRTYAVGPVSTAASHLLVLPPQVVVEVSDTGIGMDEETRRRCMEPFFSTKGERGTGLGLSMVFGVMQRHEGHIEIESALGKGTTTRLIFPVTVAGSGSRLRLEKEEKLTGLPLRVLCIDDEPLVRALMKEILEYDGHRVETADSGQGGVEAFRAAKERGEPFDVVLTDLGMPHMDGREVARMVKRESSATPVILLTGWGQRMKAEGDVSAQVDYVLSKPPRVNELREVLRQVTRTSR